MRTSADALGSFVGRQPELDLVAGLLADASSGSARAVLVFGDAGLGKTALLGAAARRAGTEVLVLSGACLMLSATSVPFLAIRSLVRSCPPAPSAGSVPGFDGVEPSDALLRFDAWLDRLCAERTVMLIVDDLHWADESTLDLLTYLLAGPADRRLLVAGTIRSGEAPDGSPLQAWLANARRFPRVGEIALDPLDREATTAQLAEILGGQPHQSLVEDVVHRTGGNPYFIRLIATGLRPSDRSAPRTLGGDLRSVLLQSWSRLTPPARELSRILAVAGRPTSEVELADVAALTGIRPALDELVQAGVVDVRPGRTLLVPPPADRRGSRP